jgi:hypothetical protein
MVFLNPYLRFRATSSRTARIISARGGRGSADRTKFTMFKTLRVSCVFIAWSGMLTVTVAKKDETAIMLFMAM